MDLYYKFQEYREMGKEEGKKIARQEASAEISREKERADKAEAEIARLRAEIAALKAGE